MRDIYHDELDDIGNRVVEMTQLVAVAMDRSTAALLDANLAVAEEVISQDARVDALRRTQRFHRVGRAGIDMTLLGRYSERYADHAVAVARRTIFIVTGELPDAQHSGLTA